MALDSLLPPPAPPLSTAPGFTVRVLPPDEWGEKVTSGELAHYPILPDPEYSYLLVVEDAEGRIVASWFAQNEVHLEGLYLAPEHRKKGRTIQTLLFAGMLETLRRGQIAAVLTLAQDPSILHLAQHAGFVEVPGTLLQLVLSPPEPESQEPR